MDHRKREGASNPIEYIILIINQQKQKRQKMGANAQNKIEGKLQHHSPPLDQYQLIHSGLGYYIWNHRYSGHSLIEYPCQLPNQNQLNRQLQFYMLRHHHPHIVSTQYLSYSPNQHKINVFYERIVTNLAKITDIPLEDTIKLYSVAFRGFQKLYHQFGYFQIAEDLFFISQTAKIKVWCNKDINKNYPSVSGRGNQGHMVKQIIRIIQANTQALEANEFPLSRNLYQNFSQSFQLAIRGLEVLCREQSLRQPSNLECLDVLNNKQVSKKLDIFICENEGNIRRSPPPKQLKGKSPSSKTPKSPKSPKSPFKGLTVYNNSKLRSCSPEQNQNLCSSPNKKSYIHIITKTPEIIDTFRQHSPINHPIPQQIPPPITRQNRVHVNFSHHHRLAHFSHHNPFPKNNNPKVFFFNGHPNFSPNIIFRPKSCQASKSPIPYQKHCHFKPSSIMINERIPRRNINRDKQIIYNNSMGSLSLKHPQFQNNNKVSHNSTSQTFFSSSNNSNHNSHVEDPSLKQQNYVIRVVDTSNTNKPIKQKHQYEVPLSNPLNQQLPKKQSKQNIPEIKHKNVNDFRDEENQEKKQVDLHHKNIEEIIQIYKRRQPLSQISDDPGKNQPFFSKFRPLNTQISQQTPTVPDLSDITPSPSAAQNSYGTPSSPQKTNKTPIDNNQHWHLQSTVVHHDPNESMIKIPEYKKYKIEIDPEILEDLNKLRERKAMPI